MLEFLRKHQRFFFLFITIIVVGSFSFFGTYSTFSNDGVREDRVIGEAVDGSPIKLSEVQLLSRFISSDREDLLPGLGQVPNFCNDGVIRNDLLRTGLADLLAASYFEPLKDEMGQRLERAKRYRPYMHPEAPFLSARSVWDRFMPGMGSELDLLQAEEGVSSGTFTHFARLYQQQSYCPPEFLRRVLLYHQQQAGWVRGDQRLQYDDLSLFGFHSLADWFGRDFVDLSAEFILNAARVAEQKGYRVAIEEAKGDLLRNFNASMQKLAEMKNKPDLTFRHHLRTLGFDEKAAAEVWRSVLLFRRYFHGVGEATFVDRLPYRDFASFALEKAIVQQYQWPTALRLRRFQDFVELEFYLKSVAKEKGLSLPSSFLSLDEIEKKYPELIQTSLKAKTAKVSVDEIGLKASIVEVCDWQLEEKNWDELKKKFSFLSKSGNRDERFASLEKLDPAQRAQLDRFARDKLVQSHPEWIDEALLAAAGAEQTIFVSKDWISLPDVEKPNECAALLKSAAEGKETISRYSADGKIFYRFGDVEKVAERHLLTFEEAKRQGLMAQISDRILEAEYPKLRTQAPAKFQVKEGEWKPFDTVKEDVARLHFADVLKAIGGDFFRRLEAPTKEAWASLQANPEDARWIKSNGDLLSEQFKLERNSREIQRTAKEEWMKEEAFVMVPKQWSPIHFPEDGDISFFYFEEKKPHQAPILEQLTFGKETIAADAQRYVAEALLESAKKKHSIVIPLQVEKE